MGPCSAGYNVGAPGDTTRSNGEPGERMPPTATGHSGTRGSRGERRGGRAGVRAGRRCGEECGLWADLHELAVDAALIGGAMTVASAALVSASPQVTPVAGSPGLWWVGASGFDAVGGERELAHALLRVARRWHPRPDRLPRTVLGAGQPCPTRLFRAEAWC